MRVNTSLGDRFETEAIRPARDRYAFFVVAIPAAKAPLEMQIEEIEFARYDRVGRPHRSPAARRDGERDGRVGDASASL